MARPIVKILGTLAIITLVVAASKTDDENKTKEVCQPELNGEHCTGYPFKVCDDVTFTCVHKSLFPAESSEIMAYILLPILMALASVGGIGGGIILVPILISMFHFSTKESIAISPAIVAESALIRFVFFSAHEPHPDRPGATVIDYNVVRVAYPIFLVGSYFGTFLSVSLGELFLAIMIMVVLTLLAIQLLWKAVKLYKRESI